MSLWLVVGGQFGGEGKGKVSAFITRHEQIDICIRCGGPNSGHSFIDEDGTEHLVRQLPTGFIRSETRLLIPAGALIDLAVLKGEVDKLKLDESCVGVDRNAFVVESKDLENEVKLGLHERLSSTLCGVGSAVSRRALRGTDARLAKDVGVGHHWLSPLLTDVSHEVNKAIDQGKKVLIEGTQGFGLSLYHTQEYPKATSRDTTAAAFLSEVGLSPRLVSELVMVLRTYPIRVAGGQAGALKDEITWETLQKESGYPYPVHELTTVTRRTRRIGRFDWELVTRAVEVNRPTKIAVMGLDYLDFGCFGVRTPSELTERAKAFVAALDERLGVPVTFGSTSPRIDHMFRFDTDDNPQPTADRNSPDHRLLWETSVAVR
jgi:adenylosuccinate synthase